MTDHEQPLLEDVVATNGACLKTLPSTPLYPQDPRALICLPEVDKRLEVSRTKLIMKNVKCFADTSTETTSWTNPHKVGRLLRSFRLGMKVVG